MNCNLCKSEGKFNEHTHTKKLLFIEDGRFEEWELPFCAEHYLIVDKALKEQGSTITIKYSSGREVVLKEPKKLPSAN